jgi:hypothetical protein
VDLLRRTRAAVFDLEAAIASRFLASIKVRRIGPPPIRPKQKGEP